MNKLWFPVAFCFCLSTATAQPIGSIVAFSGTPNKIPKGWMICDGTRLDRMKEADLFDAIGTVWGGDGSDGFFLPDLRGMFLRGVDKGLDGTSSGRDLDSDKREPANAGAAAQGNSRNSVGSRQGESIRSHSHVVSYTYRDFHKEANHDFPHIDGTGDPNPSYDPVMESSTIATNTTGGSETRPINAYVYYIIRVR
jgi:microcystin-dependent protein